MTTDRRNTCPGAALRVTFDEYRAYENAGVQWETPGKEIARTPGARSEARTRCTELVEVKRSELGPVLMGLCATCSNLEARHRAALQRMREASR